MAGTCEQRDFRPFIPECTKRGLGKTKSYELANAGLLETFQIGTRRFVYLDSLLTLPQRMTALQDEEAINALKARGVTVRTDGA